MGAIIEDVVTRRRRFKAAQVSRRRAGRGKRRLFIQLTARTTPSSWMPLQSNSAGQRWAVRTRRWPAIL